jgi:Ca2+-transporting ATPase
MHAQTSSEATDWHLRDADDVARVHAVELSRGLSGEEVARRAELHGPNELAEGTRRSPWRLLLEQFADFMILVLVAAAVLSSALGDMIDALSILLIVVLNGLVGFVQAWRADHALAALRRLAAIHATVVRDGKVRQVSADALVPGDIVVIEAGNQIPADLRLTEVARLLVDESALTGESVSVEKHARVLGADAASLGDRVNMAYKGTTAAHGRGRGLVVAIGMSTELGKVASLLAASADRSTPLQRRLAGFGRRLAVAVLGICALVFAIGVLRGEPPVRMLLTAISLAVAAIPEALPAIVTVLLALGARHMVSLNALVRRLPSVETLGSVTFICSDKTGTLTQNRMRVEEVVAAREAGSSVQEGGLSPYRMEILRAAALCNDASRDDAGDWHGDPTEVALVQAAAVAGIEKAEIDRLHPRACELPFDSERKRMTTFHPTSAGLVAYTKGAPECLVPLCTTQWTPNGSEALDAPLALAKAEAMAARGLRVLALARRQYDRLPGPSELESAEHGLELLGLVALIDPPREEAARAVQDCVSAGITPVMITGDHPATALAIARRLGIASPDAGCDGVPVVLTGAELATIDEATLRDLVRTVRVYARVDPAQKIRIVEALQSHGEFVAMTGDGVNDAPALKRADIGIAMGRGGTDVAREASSLVLLDDNFATIVGAVREGRRISDNIRKFVRYAMTGNSGEIWTIFLAPLFGLPIPLLPVHILWINLVTDGLPGLALAAEPADRGIMRRPPRAPNESLFSHGMWQHILFVGLLIGTLCLGVQAWAIARAPASAQTMVFTALTLTQMAHVLAIRTETDSLWRLGLRSNLPLLGAVALTCALQLVTIYVPWLQPLFRTVALNGAELGICFATAIAVLLAVEAEKMWRRQPPRNTLERRVPRR